MMGYAAPFFTALAAAAFFISLGTGVNFARLYGRGELEKARYYVTNGLIMTVLLSFVSMIFFNYIVENIIAYEMSLPSSLKHVPTVINKLIHDYSVSYCKIFTLLSPLLYISTLLTSLLRSEGRIYASTLTIFTSLALNIILDFIFLAEM